MQFGFQPLEVRDDGGPLGRAGRKEAQRGTADADVVPCLREPGVFKQRLSAAVRHDCFPQQRRNFVPQLDNARRLGTGKHRAAVNLQGDPVGAALQAAQHLGAVRDEVEGKAVRPGARNGVRVELLEDFAQAHHFGTERDGGTVAAVEQEVELLGAESARVGAQQGKDFAVPGGQCNGPAAQAEQGLVAAQELKAVPVEAAVRGAFARWPGRGAWRPTSRRPARGLRRTLEAFDTQLRLGGSNCCLHEGQRVRCHRGGRAGDVHDSQDCSGVGVVKRNSRAAPGVHGPLVVFGTGDLDAAAKGEGSARRTGAYGRFGPVSARNEHHALGTPLKGGVALHPQEAPNFIPHRNQQSAVVAGLDQELVDDRHDGSQRMLPPVVLELVPVDGQRGCGVVRVRLEAG